MSGTYIDHVIVVGTVNGQDVRVPVYVAQALKDDQTLTLKLGPLELGSA